MTFSKLGTDTETHQLVYLPKAARLQGLYIVGLQGMGKSGLIENLIMEDINQQIGVCVLDPHGELIHHVITRLDAKYEKDVIFLDLANDDYPFGLNLFTCPNLNSPKEVEKTVDRVMHIFDKLLGVSNDTPLISQYLFHCTHTLVANPGYTMAEIPLLLTDIHCRQHLVANVKRLQTRLFWQQYEQMKPSEQLDQLASLQRRVDKFLRDITLPIVGQSRSTIEMQKIMDERKILLVKLDRTMEQATTLVGSIIVALILNASAARQTQRQFHLYADEFQRFATEDFATLLEEARKAGIGVTMAHQNRSQLELSDKQADANLKARTLNVGNIVVFRVPTDASELAEHFDTTPPPAREEDIEIIDGVEEIKTPVKDVVGHLLNKGGHPISAVVNQFAVNTLSQINAFAKNPHLSRSPMNALNSLLYAAMIKSSSPMLASLELDVICLALKIELIARVIQLEPTTEQVYRPLLLEDVKACRNALQGLTNLVRKKMREVELQKIANEIDALVSSYRNYWENTRRDVKLPYEWVIDEKKERELAVRMLASYGTAPKGYFDKIKAPNVHLYSSRIERDDSWYHFDPELLEWEEYEERSHYSNIFTRWRISPGQAYKFYREADLARVVEKQVQAEFPIFENFIWELREVMQALADDPIEVGSGLTRPRKRIQHIVHAQQTHADKEKEIAGQLLHLPKFTAWVKIAENIPQNPGKKCLKCGKLSNFFGAVYCQGCGTELPATNEYIITTLQPPKGIQQVDQRLKRIQTYNLRDGYVKKREDVEKEIIQRLTICSGSAPAQLQSPQQARHARQVAVQGNCPSCGKNNPSGSRFCNQCGAKLR